MGWVRTRIPRMALEAASVIFAVLVALAVDEWRADRGNQELGMRALRGIASEIELNLDELAGAGGKNSSFLERLDSTSSAGGSQLSAGFEYALLSASAWQTAQITRATSYLDYGLVQSLARTYELQALFVENQRVMVDLIAGGGVGPQGASPSGLSPRLRVILQLGDGLRDAYEEALRTIRSTGALPAPSDGA